MLDDTPSETATESDPTPASTTPLTDLLDSMRLYGAQPGEDEPDPRPAPEPDAIRGALGEAVDALAALLTGTLLEPDLEPLPIMLDRMHRIRRRRDSCDIRQG